MKKTFILLALVNSIINTSFGQQGQPAAERFIKLLNNYHVDSLRPLLADNFQLKRTYANFTHNKTTFINQYVPKSENFNGKFKILKASHNNNTSHFLVEDQSDYFKYLHITNPKWKINLTTDKAGRIETMIVDTTESYRTYLLQVKQKGEAFDKWIQQNHPEESKEKLDTTAGLLIIRLKEYAEKNPQ